MFAPLLADYEMSRRITVDPDAGTIVWLNGADLSQHVLCADVKAATPV
jgi:hypothetical protein